MHMNRKPKTEGDWTTSIGILQNIHMSWLLDIDAQNSHHEVLNYYHCGTKHIMRVYSIPTYCIYIVIMHFQ